MEIIKQLPKGHPGIEKLFKKNYKKFNLDKFNFINPNLNKKQIQQLYINIIENILASNSNALDVVKTLSLLNMEIDSNIDGGSIRTCCKFPTIDDSLTFLVNSRILKKKKSKEERYQFSFQEIQNILAPLASKNDHEKAIKYYEKKLKRLKDNIQDEIEILYHKVKIKPSEDLVNEFLMIANSIEEFDYNHKRLIDIGEELFVLEDKYKAPILIVLGKIFSVLGNSEDAEHIYLKALEIYKKLAEKYYKIFLPYVAATQKNLGTLYTDLKRFEEAEKIYNDALKSYKELERQYYDVHSPEFHSDEYETLEKSYTDALKSYNELLKRNYDIYVPEDLSVSDFGNIGIDLDLLEDIKDGSIDSIENYKKLAKIYYDMYLFDIAKTQSSLGLIYSELSKFDEAEKMHLKALSIKKKIAEQDPEVYMYNIALIQNSLGTVYSKLQKFKKAEQFYLEALKIFKLFAENDPKTYLFNVADVQNNLGNLYLILNDNDKAGSYFNKALKNDPTNISILYNMACLESLRKNQIKALELLAKVIELDETFIEIALEDERLDNIRNIKEFKDLIGESSS